MSINRKLSIIILFIGLLVLSVGCQQDDNESDTGPGATTSELAPVARVIDEGSVNAEGEVVPLRAVNLAFQAGGLVDEVLVSEGDLVSAGEPLIQLDAAVIESTVRQAQAGLEAAAANLQAAKAQLSLAESDKQTAEAAVALALAELALAEAGPRPEQIAAAEQSLAAAEAGVGQAAGQRDSALNVSSAQVESARARLAAAEAQFAALAEAYDSIITTCIELPDGSEVCPLLGAPEENMRAQLEVAKANREAAQLALDEALAGPTGAQRQSAHSAVSVAAARRDLSQAQLDLIKAGAREEQISLAEIGVEQAELGLEQADIASSQAEAAVSQAEAGLLSAQSAVATAQNALDRMTLVAPFDGAISAVMVEIGELVAPAVGVAELVDAGGWLVETTDLVELDIVYVAEGQPVRVTLDALPGEELNGIIIDIAQVPQLARGDVTYLVRIRLDEYPDLPIRWGMTAVVDIDTER